MNFDDSLFEDCSKEVDKRVDASQIKYDAKRCQLNVSWSVGVCVRV